MPVALIVDSPWLPGYAGLNTLDFFLRPDEWLRVYLGLRDRFPEVAWIPGYWIEYGMAAEPSAFGARINWHGNQPPSIEPVRGGLNVLFDVESRLDNRRVKIDIRNISAAKGLDYIFMQEGLFFQRVGPRTILVASNNRRMNLQQLVLRTFYLSNANPKEVKTLITQAIPPQPGRSQTIVLDDEPTNSLTIRDTEENVRLIGRLISSLDKDRAEVVMDVAIYEVNKSDLLQFGNQLGTAGSLANIGGVGIPLIRTGPSGPITGGLPGNGGANPLGYADAFTAAIGLPISNIRALQSKGNTKLVASTQIHAFNNQDSSARIGQRVPVRTATFAPITNTGGNNNNFLGDVYNYEQVGLTLKFKPIVFPNQDVQVVMEIESKDVAAGISDEQPRFIERTIKGTARSVGAFHVADVAERIERAPLNSTLLADLGDEIAHALDFIAAINR